jgi:hypothetical protein
MDMKHRKLRILWSLGCGIITVLLTVLWFRSYYYFNDELWWVDSRNHGWYLDSLHGGVTFVAAEHDPHDPGKWRQFGAWEPGPLGFERFATSNSTSYRMPYWFAVVGAAICAAIPWRLERFSLRTLLIATTLFGAGLGLIVCLR